VVSLELMRFVTNLGRSQLEGKKVLVRADLDVKINQGLVGDNFRLRAITETLQYLVGNHAKLILAGHLDRPGGRVVDSLRMSPVVDELRSLLASVRVKSVDRVLGPSVLEEVKKLEDGEILVLENVRFCPGEEKNEDLFAQRLSSLADLFVNECFATCHRCHASIVGVPQYLPSFAGIRLGREIETLLRVREAPKRPLIFIIGGAKKDKIEFVKAVSQFADQILLGGTLMFARELEGVPKVLFPVDAVRVDDIGPRSVSLFCKTIKEAGTIVWAGPMGRFEQDEYMMGTRKIAQCAAESCAFSVAGGGDTLAALGQVGLRDKFDFCSTGGGAMLKFLSKGTLPGIEALEVNRE